MRIYELLQSIVDKFVPMNEQTKSELHVGASNGYNSLKAENETTRKTIVENSEFNNVYAEDIEADKVQAKPIPKLTIKHKVVEFLEQWWVRYIIAIAFIFIVPKVKAIINGENNKDDEDDDDGDDMSFEDYMAFKRFKKSMH